MDGMELDYADTPMIRKEKNGIAWLEFELLQSFPELSHGVFLKQGGCSQSPYGGLNTGYDIGDDPEAVKANLDRIQETLGLPRIDAGRQRHQNHLVEVTPTPFAQRPECDGLYTNVRGAGLMVKHADCQVGIFYDPVCKVVATVHSGWRGSVLNIYAMMIERLRDRFGCHPANLHVAISPSLGPQWAEFKNYREELPEAFWDYQVRPLYFDFWAISRSQLEVCGVLSHHIQIAEICTYNDKEFFSYRRDKPTGRNATVAALL